MWQKIVWSLRIRRVEYRIAELPIFLIPMFLLIPDLNVLQSFIFWEALVLFLLLFAIGDLINCLADRDLDAVYKPYLTEAVLGLGIRNVWLQSGVSALAALVLAFHLAWVLQRWLFVPMVLVGLMLAYAYSMPPYRLKGRGFWQLMFYWVGLFAAPMCLSAYTFAEKFDGSIIGVAAAFGMMQTGVILINTAEDFPEDKGMNVKTIIVAIGILRGIHLSVWLTTLGGLLLGGLLLQAMLAEGWQGWAWLGIIPFGIALIFASSQIFWLLANIHRKSEGESMASVRQSAKLVPLWITSLALTTLWAAIVVFMLRASA
jgi:4-hydroxybenzoate polyprenyltransferase